MPFSKDFLWGVATASAQIEGGWNEKGKTPTIWDNAPKKKIKNADTCHTACDHFHRYKEDIALMKEMGLKAYRFSISWARIQPYKGEMSNEGIKFYSDLIDELINAGIEPIVTIYHWDLPQWIEDMGGWRNESIIDLFEEYTRIVVDAFSDRVKYWIPMNEPQCFIFLGYAYAVHAPFVFGLNNINKCSRICMLAHSRSVKVIRKYAKTKPQIGIAMAAGAYIPKDDTIGQIEIARHNTFYKGIGLMNNRWWSDPILAGKSVSAYGAFRIKEKDMNEIYEKIDFIGLNVYQPYGGKSKDYDSERRTSMNWKIDGRVLYWTTRFYYERYKLPIMITENGMADNDIVVDGRVDDKKRQFFMKDYISNLKRAADEGVPIMGYLHWSLMDNFEWAEGYGPRFGLIHVDYESQKRTIKDSAYLYKSIIENNGENI